MLPPFQTFFISFAVHLTTFFTAPAGYEGRGARAGRAGAQAVARVAERGQQRRVRGMLPSHLQ